MSTIYCKRCGADIDLSKLDDASSVIQPSTPYYLRRYGIDRKTFDRTLTLFICLKCVEECTPVKQIGGRRDKI